MAVEEKKYGIGEVQNILKEEFSDITISKIRFLEKEGLLVPERTESGYRKFTKEHIKKLGYILRLQREEYLPLSVIKRKVQDLESGKAVAGDLTVMSGKEDEPVTAGAVPLTVEMAPLKLGLSPETVRELVDYGIATEKDGPEGKYFTRDDVKVLAIAKEFFRYGIEPRHLRMFKQFIGREASLIEQIIRPQLQHKDPGSKRNAVKHLENLISVSHMFLQALLQKELSEHLPKDISLELPEDDQMELRVDEKIELSVDETISVKSGIGEKVIEFMDEIDDEMDEIEEETEFIDEEQSEIDRETQESSPAEDAGNELFTD